MRAFRLSLAFATAALAQSSTAYVDANTGITFQRYQDTTGTGFSFGVAIADSNTTSDFIGQMVMESNGTGYCGVSLAGEMTGSLLVTAWPNDDAVVSSFRETSGYTSPGVYTNSSMSLRSIANGTFINSTHMSYTFLCSGCLGTALTFAPSTSDIVLGWAVSDTTPTNPSDADSATFVYHSSGYGNFGLDLTSAKSANYATWAAMATVSSSSNSTIYSNTTTSSNSTTSSSSTNITTTVSNTTYDYIIAGAGPAGIIVAERLAESNKSVLLIERGAASTYATGGRSVVSWNDTVTQYDVPAMSYYLTTANDTSEYCTDVASMAGCILGGGTMVNALMFVRPQEVDFDDKWPTGWKWADVSDAADRLYERNPGTTLASEDGQRYDQSAYTILSSFFDKLGWSHVDAIESPNNKTKAYSYPPWDIQDGLRAGPVKSYLPTAQAMSNFKLTLNTKVIRAVRNGTTISGVEVEDSTGARQIININTGGSVILASGALSTPRILFNTGIGPTDQISIVKNGTASVTLPDEADWINLPVGQNLRDHPIFTLTFNITQSNATSMLASAFTSPNTTDIDLFAQGSGPLAQSGQRLNFWTSLTTNGTNGTTRYFQGTCNSPSAGTIRIKLYLTHGATSSGVLGITSAGATEFTTQPLMTTDADKTAVITMIDSLLTSVRNSTSMKLSDSTATGSSLVSSYISGDHFVGTAMMGTTNDGTAVVDTDTRVFGTDNLFVVDASIHPDLPTGNTQAIVMVAAEQAAAKILALGSIAGNSTSGISTGSTGSTGSTTGSTSGSTGSTTGSTGSSGDDTSSASSALTSGLSATNAISATSSTASGQTTLTVLTTLVQTVTSCAATITDCPARASESTSVFLVTSTVELTTTVCPVSEAASASSAIIASFSGSDIAAIARSRPTQSASSGGNGGQGSGNNYGNGNGNGNGSGSRSSGAVSVSASPTAQVSTPIAIGTISGSLAISSNSPAQSSAPQSSAAESSPTVSSVGSQGLAAASSSSGQSSASSSIGANAFSSSVSEAAAQSSGISSTGGQAIATPTITGSSSFQTITTPASGLSSTVASGEQTTLTVKTTQIRTITSCAATITNCPARASESTSLMVVTETIDISTTVCPVAEAESASSAIIASYSATAIDVPVFTGTSNASSPGATGYANATTSSFLSTSTASGIEAITATSPTNETIPSSLPAPTGSGIAAVPSTGLPNGAISSSLPSSASGVVGVTAAASSSSATSSNSPARATPSASAPFSNITLTSSAAAGISTSTATGEQTTITVLTTQIRTITSCAATITNCPANAAESTSEVIVTETVALTTTVCPVTEAESASSAAYASYTASFTGSGIGGIVITPTATGAMASATSNINPVQSGGTTGASTVQTGAGDGGDDECEAD